MRDDLERRGYGWQLSEHQRPDRWDVSGAVVALAGMAIIAFAPR